MKEEGQELIVDLTDYAVPTDLGAAWALVLADARREGTGREIADSSDATADAATIDPLGEWLPAEFDIWNENQREAWAWDPDVSRYDGRMRLRLYREWLTKNPDAGSQPREASGHNDADGWLSNMVSVSTWDSSSRPVAPTICGIEGSAGALFAKGRISRLYGLSGSAKSWVAKRATLEVISGGGLVLYLDADGVFEDFRDHLKLMGISRDDALSGRLHYVRVEGSLLSQAVRDLLTDTSWDMVVLDGFNVALSVSAPSGRSGHDASEVDSFFAAVFKPAEASGAAVVVIDHAKKDGESDHGSVQKRNNLTGTDYSIKRVGMIAPGAKGHAEIKLTPKDRPGWATSEQARRGKTLDDAFAYVVVDSTAGDGSVAVTINLDLPGDIAGAVARPQLAKDVDSLRRLLVAVPDGFASNSKVRAALKEYGRDMDNSRINRAAEVLVAGGEAYRDTGRAGSLSLMSGSRP